MAGKEIGLFLLYNCGIEDSLDRRAARFSRAWSLYTSIGKRGLPGKAGVGGKEILVVTFLIGSDASRGKSEDEKLWL